MYVEESHGPCPPGAMQSSRKETTSRYSAGTGGGLAGGRTCVLMFTAAASPVPSQRGGWRAPQGAWEEPISQHWFQPCLCEVGLEVGGGFLLLFCK